MKTKHSRLAVLCGCVFLGWILGFPASGPAQTAADPNSSTLPAVVTVVATDPDAAEPGMLTVIQDGEFTIHRTGPTNFALTVFFRLAGTASSGVDYLPVPRSVVIPEGQRAAKVTIMPVGDALVEGTETVVLRLDAPICIAIHPPPPECYVVGKPAEAVVFIKDGPPVGNRPPEVKLTRPFDGQTFVLPARVPIRADAVDADGYVPHIEFYANSVKIGEQTRTFIVPPPPGQHHVFEMVWTNPPLGRHALTARVRDNVGAFGASLPVTIWIVRTNEPPTNRPPVVTITAPDPVAAEGTNCLRWVGGNTISAAGFNGTNTALFLIRRLGPTNDALTVFYDIGGTASNGVDYAALPGLATIAAGRRGVEIRVWPVDNLLPEKLETIVLRLRVPPTLAANLPPYIVGDPGRAAAVLVDNDQPRPTTGVLADGCFHVMRPAVAGDWFRVEWTHDLVNWAPLCTIQIVEGALHFVDPDAEDSAQRFYRAVPVAAPAPE